VSGILGIPRDGGLHYGRFTMKGRLRFYDRSTAWGVIAGDDGRLYNVRGDQLPAPPPEEGESITFEPLEAPGGPRATAVQRPKSARPAPVAGSSRP
jgi:hypothetical protein